MKDLGQAALLGCPPNCCLCEPVTGKREKEMERRIIFESRRQSSPEGTSVSTPLSSATFKKI